MHFVSSAPPVRLHPCEPEVVASKIPSNNRLKSKLITCCLLPALAALMVPAVGWGQSSSDSPAMTQFYRGHYLHHVKKDHSGALEAYRAALKSSRNDSQTQALLQDALSNLQEDLATENFAALMPPNTIGYAEISHPADHVEKLAQLMGLTGRKFDKNHDTVTLKLEGAFRLSSDFQISPALIKEMKKFRGLAVAITGVTAQGPRGIAVIHPGDSDLFNGILETGIQLVPAERKIKGYPTYQIENQVWLVKTKRLLVVSTDPNEIANTVGRIGASSSGSLSTEPQFKMAREKNENAAVFAFANPAKVFQTLAASGQQELAIAKMMLDVDHMNFVSVAIQSTDVGAQARVDIDYQENHQSLAYGLVRTAPLSNKALNHLPAESVAVLGMGVNPKVSFAAKAAAGRYLSALDIGREFFANIEEAAIFMLPVKSRDAQIPDVGVMIASNDVEKSEQLWTTLLELPAKLAPGQASASRQTIEGLEAHVFRLPVDEDFPPLVIARLNEEAFVAGTQSAVQVALASVRTGKTLKQAPQAQSLWNATTEHSAKAALVNVGKALQMASMMENGNDADMLQALSQTMNEMNVTVVVDEAPTHFATVLNINGLPTFERVIKVLSKANRSFPSPSDTVLRNRSRKAVQAMDAVQVNDRPTLESTR